MWKIPESFIRYIQDQPWARTCQDPAFWDFLLEWVKNALLPQFLDQVSGQVDEITESRIYDSTP